MTAILSDTEVGSC